MRVERATQKSSQLAPAQRVAMNELMHSIEELLKQPEFIRSDRFGAGILNRLFAQAPALSLILTSTASADAFLQAVGRGSHRHSQGPTEVRMIANDSRA